VADTTGVSWAHATVNAVVGCEKISPGCKHCYAEIDTTARILRSQGHETWGVLGARRETKGWKKALRRLHRRALRTGERPRVFVGSLSDPFLVDPVWERVRPSYFEALEAASGFECLMLTKRAENIRAMVPPHWLERWPAHVWPGISVCTQEEADRLIPELLQVPARVRWLSCEPLLEAIDLSFWLNRFSDYGRDPSTRERRLSWVVCGGENAALAKARPFGLGWARDLRDQCAAAEVPFFMKQTGRAPFDEPEPAHLVRLPLLDRAGADPAEWPEDLRIQQVPQRAA